jgi:hypothetical protein
MCPDNNCFESEVYGSTNANASRPCQNFDPQRSSHSNIPCDESGDRETGTPDSYICELMNATLGSDSVTLSPHGLTSQSRENSQLNQLISNQSGRHAEFLRGESPLENLNSDIAPGYPLRQKFRDKGYDGLFAENSGDSPLIWKQDLQKIITLTAAKMSKQRKPIDRVRRAYADNAGAHHSNCGQFNFNTNKAGNSKTRERVKNRVRGVH